MPPCSRCKTSIILKALFNLTGKQSFRKKYFTNDERTAACSASVHGLHENYFMVSSVKELFDSINTSTIIVFNHSAASSDVFTSKNFLPHDKTT